MGPATDMVFLAGLLGKGTQCRVPRVASHSGGEVSLLKEWACICRYLIAEAVEHNDTRRARRMSILREPSPDERLVSWCA